MKRIILLGAGILALSVTASSARAGFADTLQPGNNSYEDISRESFNYQKGSAGFQVGDIVTGFSQIQTRTNGPNVYDTIYVVFSEQITKLTTSGGTTTIEFGATPASNALSLQKILPSAGISSGVVAAIFDRAQGNNFPTDLVTHVPSGATSMSSYLKNIAANGTYEAAFGFVSGNPDFFTATSALPPSAATADFFNHTPNSVTLATFNAGLTTIDNNTGKTFTDTVLGNDGNFHDFTIVSGSLRGASSTSGAGGPGSDVGYKIWGGKGSSTPNNAGAGDNASFVVNLPTVATPEPSSIVLFGIGLVGFAGRTLLRRKKNVNA